MESIETNVYVIFCVFSFVFSTPALLHGVRSLSVQKCGSRRLEVKGQSSHQAGYCKREENSTIQKYLSPPSSQIQ